VGKPPLASWNLRPRKRKEEIGPEFKQKAKLQIERIYDEISRRISNNFSEREIADRPTVKELNKFDKDAICKDLPLRLIEFYTEREFNEMKVRSSKIN
jgi:hypothetical protein